MGKNFRQIRQTLPPVVFRAIVLEQESSAYTLGTYLTEKAAEDRLHVCRRQFNPNCAEQIWLWIETVRDGEVISKKHVGVESIAEANVPCL